jgi:hypothetical protein
MHHSISKLARGWAFMVAALVIPLALHAQSLGTDCTASSSASLAFGAYSTASGWDSTAGGYGGQASGISSVAIGFEEAASGDYSAAFNYTTIATSYDSFAIGTCNLGLNESGGASSGTSWVSTDPLFEIGNGTPSYIPAGQITPVNTVPSDAFVVYKNGDTVAAGVITAKTSGGDIPMYTGN